MQVMRGGFQWGVLKLEHHMAMLGFQCEKRSLKTVRGTVGRFGWWFFVYRLDHLEAGLDPLRDWKVVECWILKKSFETGSSLAFCYFYLKDLE